MKKQLTLSLYWKCQFLFWSGAALYWGFTGYIETDFSWRLAILHFISDLFICILPTHLFRKFSLKNGWQRLGISKLLIRILPTIIFLGLVFMFLTIGKNYLFRLWFQPGFSGTFKQALKVLGLTIFITGIRIMAIWLLTYYGYHYSQREINAVKNAARLEIIAKVAAFNTLSAQLNPHFFFNALNSIKALIIENPKAARRAIDILSDLLRTSLYAGNENLVSLKTELALVKDYLELEKIRFEEKLNVCFETEKQLIDILVLRLSVHVLVENAIKHGIAKSKNGGFIKIIVNQCNECISVSVENTGKLNDEMKKGLGLNNLEERLQLQFGDKASFLLNQHTQETVIAIITTPLS